MTAYSYREHLARFFIQSTAMLLLLAALAKLYSATGPAKILNATDPLLHLSNRGLMVSIGILELAIAWFLFRGRNRVAQINLIFWLSSNFMLYRFGLHWIGYKACPCLGSVGAKLPLAPESLNRILGALVV